MRSERLKWAVAAAAALILVAGAAVLLRLYSEHRLDRLALDEAASMNMDGIEEPELVYIFNSFSSSSGNIGDPERLAEIRARLEKLVSDDGDSPYSARSKFSLAEIYLLQKEWDKGERLLQELAAEQSPVGGFAEDELQALLAMLAARDAAGGKPILLEGSVTLDGQPASGVYVVLRKASDPGWVTRPFGHYPVAVTDEAGRYRFYGDDLSGEARPWQAQPGEYEVGVGMLPEEVEGYHLVEPDRPTVTIAYGETGRYDLSFAPRIGLVSPVDGDLIEGDRIAFRWHAVPGAAYYQLSIAALEPDKDGRAAGSIKSPLEERWTGTSAEYRMEDLRSRLIGYVKRQGTSKNDFALGTQSILGVVYPGGQFVWAVDAYSAEGRKLTSSAAHRFDRPDRPHFHTPADGLTEGDRLVQQQRYEEAVAAYEREGGGDRTLRALAAMALHGITADDPGDPAKALAYLERIKKPSKQDAETIGYARKQLTGTDAE